MLVTAQRFGVGAVLVARVAVVRARRLSMRVSAVASQLMRRLVFSTTIGANVSVGSVVIVVVGGGGGGVRVRVGIVRLFHHE